MFQENDMSIVVEVSIESNQKDSVQLQKEQLLKQLMNSQSRVDVLQKSLSKSSLDVKSNTSFLKLMSRKYQRQVEECENTSPLPTRTGGGEGRKSTLNFSNCQMPLSQNPHSLVRLPRKGQNLLPAIAMLPNEHATGYVKNLGLR